MLWKNVISRTKVSEVFKLNYFHTSCAQLDVKSGFKSQTYYDDLELEQTASSKDIKEAYLRLSKLYHPDVKPDDPEAATKFHNVSQAYETLSNANLRRKYDRGVLGKQLSVADRELAKHRFEGDAFVDVSQLRRPKSSYSKYNKFYAQEYRKTSWALVSQFTQSNFALIRLEGRKKLFSCIFLYFFCINLFIIRTLDISSCRRSRLILCKTLAALHASCCADEPF